MATPLNDTRVAILLTDGFEEVEMVEPREALDDAGATTHLVAPDGETVDAWDHTDWGDTYEVDVALADATPDDYDALLLPGGVLNPDNLRTNDEAVAFARSFFEAGKPVAAICHGAQTLIEAGVLDGRRMTSYNAVKTDMKNAGAEWVDEAVVVDGAFVTSRNPDDIPAFNDAIVELFQQASSTATA